MKKILLLLIVSVFSVFLLVGYFSADKAEMANEKPAASSALAEKIRHVPLSDELLISGVLVVDIRTESEWIETGVVPGALLLTFIDQDGNYNAEAFIAELSKYVDRQDEVAILCRSGNRSLKLSKYLVQQGFSAVLNVYGGIKEGIQNGLKTVPYQTGMKGPGLGNGVTGLSWCLQCKGKLS